MAQANLKTWGLLALAVFLALVAVWGTLRYIDIREESIRDALLGDVENVEVVVANRDLLAGDYISVENVSVREIPAEFVPNGAVLPQDFEKVEGMALASSVSQGKSILFNNLLGIIAADKFSLLLKNGQRAITLPIDQYQSSEGMLNAGDFVDVVLRTGGIENKDAAAMPGAGSKVSMAPEQYDVILERVHVLAVGSTTIARAAQSYDEEQYYQKSNSYSSITVGVELKNIPKILRAKQVADADQGKLLYLLRNPQDEDKARYGTMASREYSLIETYSPEASQNGRLMPTYTLSQRGSVSDNLIDNTRKYQKYKDGKTALEVSQ